MAQFLKLEKFLHYFCLGLVAVIALTIVSALVLSFYLNFKVDRRNLTKESPYPSVSLCQVFNDDKLAEISKALYGDNKLNDYLTEIAFFTGSCYSCEQCETELKCPNLTEIISNFRVQCNGLVQNCSWNDKKFDCCKSFMPLETESGICYSINSALAYHNKDKEPISHKHNFGKLRMEVLVDIQLFIHHPKDVPYTYQRRDLRDTILLGSTKETTVKVIKLQNNETSKNCRSSWDAKHVAVYDIYSKSTCHVNCYHIAQVNVCNCTHHLMPRSTKLAIPVCDMKGLKCLTDNFTKLSEQRKACDECLSPCEDYDYKITSNSLKSKAEKDNSEISIDILFEIK